MTGAVPVFRELTDADRKRYFAKESRGEPVTLSAVPPLVKRSPRESEADVSTRILSSMLSNRDNFAVLVATLRKHYGPRVSWMTDEQIAAFADRVYREKVRESLDKAYARNGRARGFGVSIV